MICVIAAIDPHGVIGKDGKIPWNIPEDVKFFAQKTRHNTAVMGRKTAESLPNGFLPDRHNIVITRDRIKLNEISICNYVKSPGEAISQYLSLHNAGDLYIIGGAQIYKQFIDMDLVNFMYISHIKKEYPGDTYFPYWNELEDRFDSHGGNVDVGDFVVKNYKRKR